MSIEHEINPADFGIANQAYKTETSRETTSRRLETLCEAQALALDSIVYGVQSKPV